MGNSFSEIKLFQVKPDKANEFEALIALMAEEQKSIQKLLIMPFDINLGNTIC
jgi:hypothetical protein